MEIFCISVLTFNHATRWFVRFFSLTKRLFISLGFCLFACNASANLEESSWIFHHNNTDLKFKRYDIQRGSPRVDLTEVVKKFPLAFGKNSKANRYSLVHRTEKRSAFFRLGETEIRTSWGKVFVSQPPIMHESKMLVTIDFAERVIVPLLTGESPFMPPATVPEAEIVIDPGHGGNDWGASIVQGKYLIKEKDVVLIMALRLRDALEREGVKVLLTRDRDYYLSLPERSSLANKAKAKLFLSLHFNSHAETKQRRGFELYVLSMDTSESDAAVAIAKEHQIIPETSFTNVEASLGRMRAEANLESSLDWARPLSSQMRRFIPAFGKPIKMGPFYVLYGAEMPAILLELGFITSPEDMEWFHQFEKQKSLVLALAKTLSVRTKSLRPKAEAATTSKTK